jgi:hypothetical protein
MAIKRKILNKKTINEVVNSKQNILLGTYLKINPEIKLLCAVENKRKNQPHLFV